MGPTVIEALLAPAQIVACSEADYDLLIRRLRHANLLGRFAAVLERSGLIHAVPRAPRAHLIAAQRLASSQGEAVRWELNRIETAIRPVGAPVVALKGAAYLLAGLPAAHGRIFSDIDIMVPRGALEEVERALQQHGWVSTHADAYDQRYYRQWMHELPPMQHFKRKTILDVHHNILPETARVHPDARELLRCAIPVEGFEEVYVLSPPDMVLHSAAHLFHDGELENGLRDLVDLDALLRHFSREEGFWSNLIERAERLELGRALYYALRYCRQGLATPVPGQILDTAERWRPRAIPSVSVMDALFSRGLSPDHPSCSDRFTKVARWLLYVRSHYLRMPLHLLVPHLIRKAARGHVEGTA